MHARHAKRKEAARKEALSLALDLLGQASVAARGDPARARQLVSKARKVAMGQRVRIPAEVRRRFCRSCDAFWVVGENCRVRLRSGVRVVYCLSCKKYSRTRYK